VVTFQRQIEPRIRTLLFKNKMIVILGPRQSGKTTLSKKLIKDFGDEAAYFDCQLAEVRKHFVLGEPDKLLPLVKDKKIVVFDEAQTIQNIGSILKVFHDTYQTVQIIATGSSSFDLANKINEPMTGRFFEFTLLPLSIEEVNSVRKVDKKELLSLMLYGSYPAVVGAETINEKKEILKNIATTYLYKDVFVFEAIRNPKVFEDLTKLLAYQIGQLVSINELAQNLGVSRSVVLRYMRFMEQSYIIKVVHSFSNNPRNELKKAFKVVFIDTGVRNALVDALTDLEKRADKGFVFENFFFSERMKQGALEIFPPEIMFWRTRSGVEIDMIEKGGGNILAFECKWSDTIAVPARFAKAYPVADFVCVTVDSIVSLFNNDLGHE